MRDIGLQEKTPVLLLQDSLEEELQGRARVRSSSSTTVQTSTMKGCRKVRQKAHGGIGMNERLYQFEAWQVGFVEANVLIVLEAVSQDAATFNLNE
jgi:hypothetical protein